MYREVCLFDKFSYCKNGVRCLKIHLKNVCFDRECDYRKCDKRHPRPCKIFIEKGFCRFGTSCRYSHRPPKSVEEQNKKIETLENTTTRLLKQVADQDVTIKDLQQKLIEMECREIKTLQKQIDDLVEKNSGKEAIIKKLEVEFNNIKVHFLNAEEDEDIEQEQDVSKESVEIMDDDSEIEEEIELEETSVSHAEKSKSKMERKHPAYVQTHLQNVKELEKRVNKWCEGTKYSKGVLKRYCDGVYKVFWFGLEPEPAYWSLLKSTVGDFDNFLKDEGQIDKKTCLSKINDFKSKLEAITI